MHKPFNFKVVLTTINLVNSSRIIIQIPFHINVGLSLPKPVIQRKDYHSKTLSHKDRIITHKSCHVKVELIVTHKPCHIEIDLLCPSFREVDPHRPPSDPKNVI